MFYDAVKLVSRIWRVQLSLQQMKRSPVHGIQRCRVGVARVACTVAWKRQNFFDFGGLFLKNETLFKKSSTQNPSPEQFPNDI